MVIGLVINGVGINCNDYKFLGGKVWFLLFNWVFIGDVVGDYGYCVYIFVGICWVMDGVIVKFVGW